MNRQRIATTVERIINNSKNIYDSQYYLLAPAGMERLKSACMLLLAIGESIKAIVFDVVKNKLPGMLETIQRIIKEL